MIPAISIVLATYNRAKTLKSSIQSVLDQTFSDFELLIIDDGSIDETQEIVQSFTGDSRVKYVSLEHKGSAAARNHGVRMAHGRYIAFQDSDDEWLPEKLAVAVETLHASDAKFALFYSDMWRCKSNSQRTLYSAPNIDSREPINPVTLDYSVYGIGLQSTVLKRECFDEAGLFDEQLRRFIDLDFFVRLLRFCTFLKSPQALVNFHESSGISTNHQALIDARLYLLKKHHELFTDHPDWEAAQYLRLAQAAGKIAGGGQAVTYLETAARLAPEGSEPAQKAWLELAEVQKASRKSWKTQCKLTRLQEAAEDTLDDSLSLLQTFQQEQLKTLNSLPWILGNLLHGRLWIVSRKKRLKRLRELETQLDNQRYKIQQSNLISTSSKATKRQSREKNVRPVTVVIPVFNAYEEVLTCIESILIHTLHPHEILLIDDRSTDERIWPKLREYAKVHDHIRAIRNKKNLGYTRTVNIGCEFVRPSDVILLNSDTIVTPFWLEKITAAAYSRADVATVTAVSNAAGNFSVPVNKIENVLPDGVSPSEYAWWVEKLTNRRRPVTPCGNGFCLYLARIALDKVGTFDEVSFPRGYGEENDFCMRARKLGLVSLIDDATFIYHKRTASFGAEKDKLLEASKLKLQELHPDYKQVRKQWLKNDPIDELRQSLLATPWLHHFQQASSLPALLYVVHSYTGGGRLSLEDLFRGIMDRYEIFILETSENHWTLYKVSGHRLVSHRRYHFSERWQYYLPTNRERLDVFSEILDVMNIETVHFRHFIGNGPEVLVLAKKKGMRVVVSMHDFYTVCPTANLLDEKLLYCGGNCSKESGICELRGRWFDHSGPLLKNAYVQVHRKLMADSLDSSADAVVTTSEFAQAVIAEHFPNLASRLHLIEVGRDLIYDDTAVAPAPGKAVRVVCLGNMTVPKGIQLIREIMTLNHTEGGRFEFHFLGHLPKDFADLANLGGVVHGRYRRENLNEQLQKIGASFSLIASIWPETHCQTLTESWATGLPVFASDIGTLQERVAAKGGGWLLDYRDAAAWYRQMVAIVENQQNFETKKAEIRQMHLKTATAMTEKFLALYQSIGAVSEPSFTPLLH